MKPCNSVTLYPHILDWLCGELLGDGCLYSHHALSAKFKYTSKYIEYTWYVSRTLHSFGIVQAGKIYRNSNGFGTTYMYQSLSYLELRMLYDAWYPNGKKVVPKGLMLPSITCRQWYIGDGSLQHRQDGRPSITLCSDCFPISSVNWLVSQLIALGFDTTRQPNSNRVHISSTSTEAFLKYIGECPVECYRYKWDLGGRVVLEHLFQQMEKYSNV